MGTSTERKVARAGRTKIVATLGPATRSPEMIRRLIEAGADVFRLNFSHGTHDEHAETIRAIRREERELDHPVAILGDLSGPKLRITEVKGDAATVHAGDTVTLTAEPADGAGNVFQVSFQGLPEVAQPGHSILLDDGRIRLEVVAVHGKRVHCRVDNDGVIRSRKGVNLPDSTSAIPALTDKDRADFEFALEQGIDLVALSFVRQAQDLALVFEEMKRHGKRVPLIAKIEKPEAVKNLEGILDAADGAMVARGDLGIEVPMERVPGIQKQVIRACNERFKPVITATQMLESMVHNPRPTRAEVTDVFNSILDGTDAVMLSEESAVGEYPVEAVSTMDRVAMEAEEVLRLPAVRQGFRAESAKSDLSDALARAAVEVAESLHLDAIVVPTLTGNTARHLSRYRPTVPVLACSSMPGPLHSLCLLWGVSTVRIGDGVGEPAPDTDAVTLVRTAIKAARDRGWLKPGMRVVALGGVPGSEPRQTSFLLVVQIPE